MPSEIASEIYARAQSEEQAWEEKRRIRKMEEVRAASGAMTIHTTQPAPQTMDTHYQQQKSTPSMMEQISEAKKLLEDGTISDAEFQEMKAKIIS